MRRIRSHRQTKHCTAKFQRFTSGLEMKINLMDSIIWSDNINYEEINDSEYTKLFFIPFLEYSYDNTLWYETYPVKGKRLSLRYFNSLLNSSSSLNFYAIMFDIRNYSTIKNGISTAFRFFGGTIGGSDLNNGAARFRVGGTPYLPFFNKAEYSHFYDVNSLDQVYYDIYVMPLRGIPIGGKSGNNILMINAELRLPFLMYYFPAIGFLGKINGVFFSDIGVVWNDSFTQFNDNLSWESNDNFDGYSIYPSSSSDNIISSNDRLINPIGWVWSFGFGPRFILLGMPWQLDYAWQYNPIKKELSTVRWYLSIGLDF